MITLQRGLLVATTQSDNEIRGHISMTTSHNVLVTIQWKRLIREFTTHGQLMREINIDTKINVPWQSIETSSGRIVVTDWDYKSKLHLLDSNGQTIKIYGVKSSGLYRKELKSPYNFVINKFGNILICELTGYRIRVLNSNLVHVGDIDTKHYGMPMPGRIQLDESKGRLYVAIFNGGQVFVLGV